MPMPKELFVTLEVPDGEKEENGWYSASLSATDAVSNSEFETPVVGTYRLVEENTLELVRSVKIRKVKGAK
jgi:hypothetical protein